MAELRPIPFRHLLGRMLEEPARQQTLFDLPLRKIWHPRAGIDLSVAVHGHRAETPVGPAAGPHAQLAQNIVLAWLGGARTIELKTVQVLDELEIPRPCIDAATVGYNVEWSQELKLDDSLSEYVSGWMLLRILRALDVIDPSARTPASEPVFELSVGYDYQGLTSPAMRRYFDHFRDVSDVIEARRREIADPKLRDLDFPSNLLQCVTLSTFHGCPPGEIERIAKFLLGEVGVDVIVKLNPTLLGFEEVSYLLHDRMGYHDVRPKRAAFDGDIHWDEAIALGRRLDAEATRLGRRFGVKMTNTLVVENHKSFFSAPEMYLSGPPLHVLAMHCVERWRAAFGDQIPISFSGGIDQHNFADAVACDLVPVTTCTDLLRPGGYGRLPKYLDNLADEMVACGATTRDEFVLNRFGKGDEARRLVEAELEEQDVKLAGAELTQRIVRMAGVLNSHEVTARVTGDPRYAAGKNGKPPRKVGSMLVLLDCLSCDKCVPVCPNDANFAIDTPLEERAWEDIRLAADGQIARAPGGVFVVRKPSQWANYADACNECGNCDVFCPEDGGPYVVKARYFGSRESFDASPKLDGLYIEAEDGGLFVRARVSGTAVELRAHPGLVTVDDGRLVAEYDPRSGELVAARAKTGASGPHVLSGAVFETLRTLVRGALDPKRVNPVSARLPGATWPG